MLKEVFERISIKGIQLEVTDRFKLRLINEGYNPTYGARPLRRAVMRLLEDSLAEKVLGEEIKAGDTVVVDVGADNKIKVLLGEKFDFVEEKTNNYNEKDILCIISSQGDTVARQLSFITGNY